jgi:hypothetical protein
MYKVFYQYIRSYKKEFGLKDWSITIVFNPSIKNSVRFNPKTKEAVILTNQTLINNLYALKDWIRKACLYIKYPTKTPTEIEKL